MFCKKCGTEVPDGVNFCPNCGYNVSDITQTNDANSVSLDSLVKRWDNYNGEQKLIRVIFICCVGLFIMGFIMSIVSPDVNTNSDYSSSDSISSNEVVTNDDFGSSSDSLRILSCTFSTENRSDALTYCDAFVGEDYSGENVKISVLYSCEGDDLNEGNKIPKTVDSEGYVSVPSAYAFSQFPDKAIVTIYDSDENILDKETYDLQIKSGSQTL